MSRKRGLTMRSFPPWMNSIGMTVCRNDGMQDASVNHSRHGACRSDPPRPHMRGEKLWHVEHARALSMNSMRAEVYPLSAIAAMTLRGSSGVPVVIITVVAPMDPPNRRMRA